MRLALALCLMATSVWADEPITNNLAHVTGGGLLGYGVTEWTDEPLAGVAAGCGAGAFKEFVVDENPSKQDLAEWCLGAMLGVIVQDIFDYEEGEPRLALTPVLSSTPEATGLFLEFTIPLN